MLDLIQQIYHPKKQIHQPKDNALYCCTIFRPKNTVTNKK